jgi:hypothetical protein
MLRLVHPAIAGKAPVHPKKGVRSAALRLTDTEALRLRAALKNLKALPTNGTWPKLAAAMGLKPELLHDIIGGRRHPSPAVALAAARAAGATVDAMLGAPSDASTCPHCGARRSA